MRESSTGGHGSSPRYRWRATLLRVETMLMVSCWSGSGGRTWIEDVSNGEERWSMCACLLACSRNDASKLGSDRGKERYSESDTQYSESDGLHMLSIGGKGRWNEKLAAPRSLWLLCCNPLLGLPAQYRLLDPLPHFMHLLHDFQSRAWLKKSLSRG